MIKPLLKKSVFFFLFLLMLNLINTQAQTTGSFNFSVTTTPPTGNYSGENVLAIWIENNAGAFIMTKWQYTGGESDHLATWVAKSAKNGIGADAASGATLSGGQTITFAWNGTNTSGSVVADGSYKVWLEMAWGRNLVEGTDKITTSYPFTKGTTLFTSNPSNTSYFSTLSLEWKPTTTGIEGVLETGDFNIYPNPSTGLLKVDFKKEQRNGSLLIYDKSGKLVYNERMNGVSSGEKTFDLTRLNGGNYFGTLRFPGKDVVFNLILVK